MTMTTTNVRQPQSKCLGRAPRRALLLVLCSAALLIPACSAHSLEPQAPVSARATARPTPADSPAPPAGLPSAPVVRVVDGDTIDVVLDGKRVRVRLIGINTPESVDPRRPVECFGREASAKAKDLLTGQTVLLEADLSQSDEDRNGRLLRYVWLADGTLFNLEMLRQGFAFEYTYDLPYAYQAEFKQAERDAREHQRGLWAPETCDGQRRPAGATLVPPDLPVGDASEPISRPSRSTTAAPELSAPARA